MNDRAEISYTDVVLVFATLVSFSVVAPWVSQVQSMLRSAADPPTSVLVGLLLPLLLIGLIYSMGVSARS